VKYTSEVVQENDKRLGKMFSPYNPMTGEGSPIPRFEVKIDEDSFLLLPLSLKSEVNVKVSIEKSFGPGLLEELNRISKLRLKHDFEYFAATCVKIKPKEGGDPIPFFPNRPQRKIIKELEKMRLENKPIRLILLKSRQYGGSTLIQVYMAWIQLFHMTNWNSLIAAHVKQAASNIRFMYSTIEKYFPDEVMPWSLKTFEGSSNVKIIPERSNKITIGSMETPDSIRSEDIAMAHLSEVGLWKKTEGKEPKDMAQSILGTIPAVPYSLYILESTAKGVGNFFHRSWTNAVDGHSNMQPVFVGWHEFENYMMIINSKEEAQEICKTMTTYEDFLWTTGATLEGIKWYRWKLAEFEGDTWRMQSEFPSTAAEAFQSTGKRVFSPLYVLRARKTCKPPIFIGDVFADAMKGAESLENIRFEETPKGNLWIWKHPHDPPLDENEVMENRYCTFADIGGRTDKADYSVISVFDRYWMSEGGVPERCATWKGHIDQDLFAWKLAQISKMYGNALAAIEVNSMKLNEGVTEGDHAYTVLDQISDHYENLYTRTTPEQIRQGLPRTYGFHTNSKSKGMIVDSYNAILRDSGYIEYDRRALDEADMFELKQNGITMGATDGNHDDELITTMGGLWIATEHMPLPAMKTTERKKPQNRNFASM
jgi:hypothetical protein